MAFPVHISCLAAFLSEVGRKFGTQAHSHTHTCAREQLTGFYHSKLSTPASFFRNNVILFMFFSYIYVILDHMMARAHATSIDSLIIDYTCDG